MSTRIRCLPVALFLLAAVSLTVLTGPPARAGTLPVIFQGDPDGFPLNASSSGGGPALTPVQRPAANTPPSAPPTRITPSSTVPRSPEVDFRRLCRVLLFQILARR
jgi:hypothetical protein